jgi:hypothetical protein
MTSFTYAGVGSRKTPPKTRKLITALAAEFRMLGGELRSGGAEGADTEFARGARKQAQIFLPRPGFDAESFGGTTFDTPAEWTEAIAADAHPRWESLEEWMKELHRRNAHQILGLDGQSPADFVVCWTPDGCTSGKETTRATGGTGQALRIADAYGVPIFNLAVPGHAAAALALAWQLSGSAAAPAVESVDLMGYLSVVMGDVLLVEAEVAREGLQAAQKAFRPGGCRDSAAREAAQVWFPGEPDNAELALQAVNYAGERARAFHAAQASPAADDLVDVVVDAYGGRVSRTAAAVGLHAIADAFDGTGFGSADAWTVQATAAARAWGLFAGRPAGSAGWPVVLQATTVLRRVAAAAM